MVKEMTKGKPLSLILGFCIPMLLGNLFQQLYSMVDTIIVGKALGTQELAAVGSTGAVSFLVLGFVMGITSGCCILPAQSFGAGRIAEMRRLIANAAYICIFATIVITALSCVFAMPLLQLMQTPPDIINMAYDYIITIFAGICVTMLYNLLAGVLRAMGDSRTPLYFLILSSLLNVGLDLLFILVLGMGVAGAGWATVTAQAVSGILCLFYIRRCYPVLSFSRDELTFSPDMIKRLAKVGLPMACQFSITAIGSILLQTAVNGLGTVYVAAVTAAGKLQNIVAAPMETLGVTMATYAGQNLGAGRVDRIREGMSKAFLVSMSYCVFAAVLIWFLGGSLCLLFMESKDAEVITAASHFMQINCLFYPMLGALFLMRNMLQGIGMSLLPMMAGVSELAARAVVSLGFVSLFGFDAVCFASPMAWSAATVLLAVIYIVKMKRLSAQPVTEKQPESRPGEAS